MDKQTLIRRREELAQWLADNLDSIRWEEMKQEFNNLTYRIQEFSDRNNVSRFQRVRTPLEFRIPITQR